MPFLCCKYWIFLDFGWRFALSALLAVLLSITFRFFFRWETISRLVSELFILCMGSLLSVAVPIVTSEYIVVATYLSCVLERTKPHVLKCLG